VDAAGGYGSAPTKRGDAPCCGKAFRTPERSTTRKKTYQIADAQNKGEEGMLLLISHVGMLEILLRGDRLL
jgi:hypothetical protein